MSNPVSSNPLQTPEQLAHVPEAMTMADVILSRVFTLEQSQARIAGVLSSLKTPDQMKSIVETMGSTVVASEKQASPNSDNAAPLLTGAPKNTVTKARENLKSTYALAA